MMAIGDVELRNPLERVDDRACSSSGTVQIACRTSSAAMKSKSGVAAAVRSTIASIAREAAYVRNTGPVCAPIASMCRVRSSSLSGRVFSCFLITPLLVLVDREARRDAGLHVAAHLQAVHVKGGCVFDDERRTRSQIAKVFAGPLVHLIGIRIGAGGKSISARDTCRKLSGLLGRERARLLGADDVIRHGGDRGGRLGVRT